MDYLASVIEQLPTTPVGWLQFSGWFFLFWAIASVPAFFVHKYVGEPVFKSAHTQTLAFGEWARQLAAGPIAALRRDIREAAEMSRHVFVPRIDAVGAQALAARSAVAQERRRMQKMIDKGGGGLAGALAQLGQLRTRIRRLQALEKIHPEDAHELAAEGRGSWLVVIVLTPIALLLAIANTFLLQKVFTEFDIAGQERLFGFIVNIPMVLALIFTLVEMALGLLFERANDRADSAKRAGEDPGMALLMGRLILILFLIAVIAFETMIYVVVSNNNLVNVLPAEWLEAAPWMSNWFGLFGFILAGGITATGYALGQAASELLKRGANATIGEQAELYNSTLEQMREKLTKVDKQIELQQNTLGAASSTTLTGDEEGRTGGPDAVFARLENTLLQVRELGALDDEAILHASKTATADSVNEPMRATGISAFFLLMSLVTTLAVSRFFDRAGGLFGDATLALPSAVGFVVLGVFSGFLLSYKNDIAHEDKSGRMRFHTTHWSRGWPLRAAGALGVVALLAAGWFVISNFSGTMRWLVSAGYIGFVLVSVTAGSLLPEVWNGAVILARLIFSGLTYGVALVASILAFAFGAIFYVLYAVFALIAAPMLTLINGVTTALRARRRPAGGTMETISGRAIA